MLAESIIQQMADDLYTALRQQQMIAPLSEREPTMTVEDAYAVSSALLQKRIRLDGEKSHW